MNLEEKKYKLLKILLQNYNLDLSIITSDLFFDGADMVDVNIGDLDIILDCIFIIYNEYEIMSFGQKDVLTAYASIRNGFEPKSQYILDIDKYNKAKEYFIQNNIKKDIYENN